MDMEIVTSQLSGPKPYSLSLSLRTVRSLARVFLDQCTLCQPLIIIILYTNSLQGARTTDQILSASDQVEEKVLAA